MAMEMLPHLSVLRGPSTPTKQGPVHKLFTEICKEVPNNPALIFEESNNLIKYTYQELDEISNKIAKHLLSVIKTNFLKINSDGDKIVAVCMPPSEKLVAVLLGIWKSGAAYLPLDPSYPDGRLEHILREAKPMIVIYEEYNHIFQLTYPISLQELEDALKNLQGGDLRDEECDRHDKDNLAVVLYTSGSTGVPKGVRLPHEVILNRLQWEFRTFPYSKTETVGVFKTTLTFVDSIPEIWGPLIKGLAILIVPKSTTRDPEKLVDILEKYKRKEMALQALKMWVCSGETLSVSLSEEFFKYFKDGQHILCNFYGCTEIMDASYHILKDVSDLKFMDKVPIGVPVDNSILYILDEDHRLVNENVVGELYAAGGNVAAGYVNGRDPEKFIQNALSVEQSFDTLFKTGDFAKLSNGVLVYEGRTDSQIKIRGHRVDLTEVEKALASVPIIDKCAVLCYKPGEINQALLAFVTTKSLMSENQIESLLRTKLSSYMIPQVILIDVIPLLVNGKIDRQALLKSYENTNNNDHESFQGEIDYSGVPANKIDTAKVLFETVASVLSRSARAVIGMNANFYEIGGNSQNTIFTISTLNEKGYRVSIGDFIAATDLGEVLERMVQDGTKTRVQPSIFRSRILQDEHKLIVTDMIISGFSKKGDLEQWLPEITENDTRDYINIVWDTLVEDKLSFVAISEETNKLIGCAFNFDAHDQPEVELNSKESVIVEFVNTIEGPIRDQLPAEKGKVLYTSLMTTDSSLADKENVAIIKFMEDEVLKLAHRRNFIGILTTNTNRLTQQLDSSVYGYRTMYDCQVNQYVASDNTRPFGLAPDSQRAIVHWKHAIRRRYPTTVELDIKKSVGLFLPGAKEICNRRNQQL